MNLTTFKNLHQRRQNELLCREGHLLAEHAEDGCRLTLYALADFYAEVWRLAGEEHILFIHPFQHPHGLHPYLNAIRLPEV